MMKDKIMRIVDEEGNEQAYEILFTFTSDVTKKSYVVYKKPGDSEEVYASIYTVKDDEGGDLLPIETDAEYDMVQEKLDAFRDEEDDE